MSWFGSGQALIGVGLLVVWWFALRLARTDKPLSAFGFAAWPALFLLWAVGAAILIFHGLGSV